tara:strand:+ start:17727 stop:18170 length:444 start_codon:yes stop_codon:yes gene_type:complete
MTPTVLSHSDERNNGTALQEVDAEDVVFQKKMSIPDLAKVLESVQSQECFLNFEICMATKTSGGISVLDRETGKEIHIIRGVKNQEWPYITDCSLEKVKSASQSSNFIVDGFQVSSLARCRNLSPKQREMADVILNAFSIHNYNFSK